MKLLFVFIISFITVMSFAQGEITTTTTCNISPLSCSYDLRDPILAYQGKTTSIDRCYAKGCNTDPVTPPGNNFHDVDYADADPGTLGCKDAPANCSKMDGSILRYIAYYPLASAIGSDFSTCRLPVVIFFHGGSFADCNGMYTAAAIAEIGKNFAERGFIFISVEYRKGVKIDGDGSIYYTAQQMLAIWRACQDARGAVRSIIKRELSTASAVKETEFHIDPNNIFLAGNSAGSVIAMNLAYYTDPMVTAAFPSGIDAPLVLGNINQNFYVGGDGTGTNGINFTVKGVLDLWGGILLPNTVTVPNENAFFFNNGHTLPPTIAFCGAQDPTFPPLSRVLKFQNYTSESYCLNDPSGSTSFQVTPSVSPDFINYGNILGSQTIYEMLQSNGVLTEFYEDCDMHHGLDADCGNCPGDNTKNKKTNGQTGCLACAFLSNFGTNNYSVSSVNKYIVQRAATFFQAVMNNVKPDPMKKHTSKFVECENYRYGCNLMDNNNNCYKDNVPLSQVCPSSQMPQ